VGVYEGRLVATVTLKPPGGADSGYYGNLGVASFGQFGVDLSFQRSGLGAGIMQLIEDRAREMGATELACDTAQPAGHLVRWYQSMGYQIVEEADWRPTTNYKSWILSKKL
jgi:GNAT superfamily N-acetyltransferase